MALRVWRGHLLSSFFIPQYIFLIFFTLLVSSFRLLMQHLAVSQPRQQSSWQVDQYSLQDLRSRANRQCIPSHAILKRVRCQRPVSFRDQQVWNAVTLLYNRFVMCQCLESEAETVWNQGPCSARPWKGADFFILMTLVILKLRYLSTESMKQFPKMPPGTMYNGISTTTQQPTSSR